MGVGVQRHALVTLPPGMTQYLLHRSLGVPQGWYGLVWRISAPPRFDPQTIQPIVTCYTNYTILARGLLCNLR
jgi:hypothetical protein